MKAGWWIERTASDTRISADARLLLIWFATRPRGWRYSVDEAMHVMGFGKERYQGVLRELKAGRYVETTHKRDRAGRIKATLLRVCDTPSPEAGFSSFRKAAHRKPDSKAAGPEAGKSGQTKSLDTKGGETPSKEVGSIVAFPVRRVC